MFLPLKGHRFVKWRIHFMLSAMLSIHLYRISWYMWDAAVQLYIYCPWSSGETFTTIYAHRTQINRYFFSQFWLHAFRLHVEAIYSTLPSLFRVQTHPIHFLCCTIKNKKKSFCSVSQCTILIHFYSFRGFFLKHIYMWFISYFIFWLVDISCHMNALHSFSSVCVFMLGIVIVHAVLCLACRNTLFHVDRYQYPFCMLHYNGYQYIMI